MEIMDIIKEAFIFPSQNLEKLAIYIVLTFVMGLFIAGGVISGVFAAIDNSVYFVITAILAIIAIAIAFIISGYQIGIIKSGIDQNEEAPSFDWLNDLVTGIKTLVVSIVYFIIPAIIIAIVALITNIPGQIVNIAQQAALNPANATAVANGSAPIATISDAAAASLFTSIAITGIIALVLIIIFAFLATMGTARLANTGSLAEAVNVVEAFKDITRIGVGKVIAVIILSIIVVAVINGVLGYLYGQIPQLSIISVIVTPYLVFFTNRVTGLLYSDIA
ncbi:DUF4013 domain-containing protein [uncultured Methanobrevibacter sp.]|uniref:DUF4013 domain-containing protein n=1 Tax=uncultured Methanobrevibacter sp. TaxID=253161 RepID=UPI002619AAE6|nr:DUF4013 domain-containing protein [uncultured Methanobrevibacter sp.]